MPVMSVEMANLGSNFLNIISTPRNVSGHCAPYHTTNYYIRPTVLVNIKYTKSIVFTA